MRRLGIVAVGLALLTDVWCRSSLRPHIKEPPVKRPPAASVTEP